MAPSAVNFLIIYRGQDPSVEKYILKILEWNMSYPNPIHFLRQISKVDKYSVQAHTVASTLCAGERTGYVGQ